VRSTGVDKLPLALCALLLAGCERAGGQSSATGSDPAFAIPRSPLEGGWLLASIDGRPVGPIQLWIERTGFTLQGCGEIHGRMPPTNGPRRLYASESEPVCTDQLRAQQEALVSLLRSGPEARVGERGTAGCGEGRSLTLTSADRRAVFCGPGPTEG
jgi:hypothetical protein